MPTVHPTALVADTVRLADDVIIGPYCLIEGDVALGQGTRLLSHVTIKGPANIGQNNTLYPFVCLGYEPQDVKFHPDNPGPGLVIGNENTFRESFTMHRGTQKPTAVGSNCHLMANTHLAHDVQMGDRVTLANGALLAGHVIVGDDAFIGGNAAVHQHCQVGRLTMVGGLTPAHKDIPPFCTATHESHIISLNLIGLRRHGLREHVEPLQKAFEILFHQQHTNPVAADMITEQLGEDPLCQQFVQAIRDSRRGFLPAAPHEH